jgi:hypothetical protein
MSYLYCLQKLRERSHLAQFFRRSLSNFSLSQVLQAILTAAIPEPPPPKVPLAYTVLSGENVLQHRALIAALHSQG